jgi:hypothetical protein
MHLAAMDWHNIQDSRTGKGAKTAKTTQATHGDMVRMLGLQDAAKARAEKNAHASERCALFNQGFYKRWRFARHLSPENVVAGAQITRKFKRVVQ